MAGYEASVSSNLPTYPPLVVDECSDPGLGETIDLVHLLQSDSIPDLPRGRKESLIAVTGGVGSIMIISILEYHSGTFLCSQGAQTRSNFVVLK